jgi:hypothetical protein
LDSQQGLLQDPVPQTGHGLLIMTSEPVVPAPRGSLPGRIALGMGTIFLMLALIEILASLFMPESCRREMHMRNCNVFQFYREHTRFHPRLGYWTRPNLDLQFNDDEFSIHIKTNSLGFRDDEASVNGAEVLLLGDSFCFGWGVEEPQSCAAVFEASSGIQTLNMGISGYSTLQEFLLLQEYGKKHPLRGKTAFFLFYANDLQDNRAGLLGLYPSLQHSGRAWILTHPIEDAFESWMDALANEENSWLGRHSFLWDRLRIALHLYQRKNTLKELHERHPAIQPYALRPERFATFSTILRRITDYSKAQGMKSSFVLIPSISILEGDAHEGDWEGVRRCLEEASIPFLDLLPDAMPEDYFRLDSHWNAHGQEKAGNDIYRFYRESREFLAASP